MEQLKMQIDDPKFEKVDLQIHFDKIYVAYFPRMYRFAREYVLLDEDAENIVQDVFLLLWEKKDVLDIQVSILSYLFSLVKNRCLDHLRHQVIAEDFKQEFSAKLAALEQMSDSLGAEEELEEAVRIAVDKLPDRCKEIFIKSRVEGKKYREIADELELSVNTVENQMSIALKRLRYELKDFLPLLFFFINVK